MANAQSTWIICVDVLCSYHRGCAAVRFGVFVYVHYFEVEVHMHKCTACCERAFADATGYTVCCDLQHKMACCQMQCGSHLINKLVRPTVEQLQLLKLDSAMKQAQVIMQKAAVGSLDQQNR